MLDQPDPSTLSDEELDKAITDGLNGPSNVAPKESPAPTPTLPEAEEQQPEGNPEPEAPVEPENPAESAEEQRPPSRREQLRISQILAKREQATKPPVPQPRPDQINYEKDLNAEPETVKRLETDRTAARNEGYQDGMKLVETIQWKTRLDIDAPRIESQFKYLNPHDKENFDPIRSNAMSQLYLQYVGYDPGDPANGIPESVARPDIRYSDFVEAQVEFAEALLAEKQVRTAQNLTKQAATTGIRPDGSAARPLNLNKAPEDMSDEELDAVIAQSIPPRR